jgi:hypothetical protein
MSSVVLLKFTCRETIERYERLLRTPLTELERDFIHRRLSEERKAVNQCISGAKNACSVGRVKCRAQ